MVKVLIRGAGDLASGVAIAFHKAGFQVLMTEMDEPTVIRRTVSFATALFDGQIEVEGTMAIAVDRLNYKQVLEDGHIGVMADPDASILEEYKPAVLVDGILAKKNLGTKIEDAPIVIACGPGFSAGEDCHRVIETKRGHYLARVIEGGTAAPNSGIPGIVEGHGLERVLYAPTEGRMRGIRQIGDIVEEGDAICEVSGLVVHSPFKGVLRGLLAEGLMVPKGMKIGDVDPRIEVDYCHTISDKARAVGRGALEAALELGREKGLFEVKQ